MITKTDTTYSYDTIPNDPIGLQTFTLTNGLRLFLSVNKAEPRIHTNIAVRAGSKHDPAETTGLAHYMEHMLFKGTSRIGTLDWEKEKVLLEKISDLYELHRQTSDMDERRRIYGEIDRLSNEAAKLSAPGEYDKLAATIGAKGTNAYTWVEQTVYVNDIPSNELERWFYLESERFRMMALRLFHTELETVYEEFNISQDQDARKVNNAIRTALFPQHPYGTQTTIGSAEHLRNPSQKNIQGFFSTYYVPNNMGILLSGDFDPDEAVQYAEKYFGSYTPKPLPPFAVAPQPALQEKFHLQVYGQLTPYVDLAWRLEGAHSDDPLMLTLIDGLLHNGQAGLLDLHLNQQQKVLEAESWAWLYEDYSVFGLYGKPREGQMLEEVEQLMLGELDRLRRGEFPDWLLEGVIRDQQLSELQAFESNKGRISAMTQSFILGISWQRFVDRFEWFKNVTRDDIANFVRKRLGDNYVLIHKLQGDDPSVIKVEKPPITPVAIQRDALSDFARDFMQRPSPDLEPEFVDYKQAIQHTRLKNGLQLDYVRNRENELFRFDIILPAGKLHDLELSIAMLYFPYLGSGKYSAQQVQQELFRLGLKLDTQSKNEKTFITLRGLQESFEAGLKLLDHLLTDLQPDERALQNVVNDILQMRESAKRNRQVIVREALADYALYGEHSPFTYRIPREKLLALEAGQLTQKITSIRAQEHWLYYYGPAPISDVAELLEKHHLAPAVRQQPGPRIELVQRPTEENQVFFLDFPIVQTDIMLVSRGTPHFNLEEHVLRGWFNDYFGLGLSSVVFQEIRESKALAYSTYAIYGSPRREDQAHYLQAYVGTQPDKIGDALPALFQIINDMPVDRSQIERSRLSVLKQIASSRSTRKRIYWDYQLFKDRGFERDLDQDIYEKLSASSIDDLLQFQREYVQGSRFNIMVLGSRERVDMEYLRSFGPVRELTMQDVFGY
ncbi:insulinase family protein [Flavilitoribacter nigricans]|uniref:Peptidase M16 n=1 Tax=Flavilitoribacter nigricans (strain ATCC 23147 / DSM 23189 / NBRC 102662 / NCIMB 1420 / SS-2) TaxID=1122177 RepID=A0A2D0NKM9_FLAN2|nr:insulinase family protein [Flavilitoribacter nigricans]PHN08293.1 peptidase M16 [Flavilitoribacter nigricans DSM 23189 = NBRC 102662]